MTAKMFEFFSAKSIARRLLAIDVPMVRMRVTPASLARRSWKQLKDYKRYNVTLFGDLCNVVTF